MNTSQNEIGAGVHKPTLFPRMENRENGWVLQYDLLTRITNEVTAAGWAVSTEEVELVLLAAENILADTSLPVVPAAGTELDSARLQAAAWLLVSDAASRDVQILLAALRTTVSWCENPNNRTMHTLRQQCSMLDALRDLAKAALDKVPDEPREPAVVEVSLLGDAEFRALLDLFMCADPWPIHKGEQQRTVLEALLNQEARRRGYTDWVDADHGLANPTIQLAEEGTV